MSDELQACAAKLSQLPVNVDEWNDNDKHIAANFIDAYLAENATDDTTGISREATRFNSLRTDGKQ